MPLAEGAILGSISALAVNSDRGSLASLPRCMNLDHKDNKDPWQVNSDAVPVLHIQF